MDLGLTGKNVFIGGGSKGIGFACAELFAREGARVAIASRSNDNVEAALRRLPGGFGVAADLRSPEAALAAIEAVELERGPIDVLVNAAGAAARALPADLTPAIWREAMDAKFFTYINLIDPLIKRMAARRTGVIVNIIGSGGKVARTTHISGGAANAALMLATAGLGAAYASQGIRIVGINPGLTETERVTKGLATEAELAGISLAAMRATALGRIPMGRFATPQDVANVVLFLASEQAAYLTGVTITMDGSESPVIV